MVGQRLFDETRRVLYFITIEIKSVSKEKVDIKYVNRVYAFNS